jgi:hypothetical protein
VGVALALVVSRISAALASAALWQKTVIICTKTAQFHNKKKCLLSEQPSFQVTTLEGDAVADMQLSVGKNKILALHPSWGFLGGGRVAVAWNG